MYSIVNGTGKQSRVKFRVRGLCPGKKFVEDWQVPGDHHRMSRSVLNMHPLGGEAHQKVRVQTLRGQLPNIGS